RAAARRAARVRASRRHWLSTRRDRPAYRPGRRYAARATASRAPASHGGASAMTRNDHIDLERLSDFVDDRLLGDDRDAVQAQLASCMSCASQLARLQSLLEAAHALPDEIEPPPAVWAGGRARLPRREPARYVPPRCALAA